MAAIIEPCQVPEQADLIAVMREQKTKVDQQMRAALAVKVMEMVPIRHQDGVHFFNSADIDANQSKIVEVMLPLVQAIYKSKERGNLYKVQPDHLALSLVKFIMKGAGMPTKWSESRLGPTLPSRVFRFIVPLASSSVARMM